MRLARNIILPIIIILLTIIFLESIADHKRKKIITSNPHYFSNRENNIFQQLNRNSRRVIKGDSIYKILLDNNIELKTINRIVNSLNKNRIRLKIKPGDKYTIITDKENQIDKIIFQIENTDVVVIEKTQNAYSVSRRKIPAEYRYFVTRIVIEDSLFETLNRSGYKDIIAYKLNSIFLWDIDFNTEIYNGDRLTMIYEKIIFDDGRAETGRIIGAKFELHGRIHRAYGYYDHKNTFGYYDQKGNTLRKAFLRSPLKYTRISSRFSYRRFHPILRIYRPHLGIDYAAPIGTPVVATADGRITFKGWDKNGGGNVVKIKHKNGYLSTYMHLRRFAKNIYRGKYIKQSKFIGYVGSTGLSTGPHLDYRIQHNGKYINPLTLPNPRAEKLTKEILKTFRFHKSLLDKLLNTDHELFTEKEITL